MKTQEAIYNGEKIEVIVEIDKEEKEYVLMDDKIDETLDLTEILENTMEINLTNES